MICTCRQLGKAYDVVTSKERCIHLPPGGLPYPHDLLCVLIEMEYLHVCGDVVHDNLVAFLNNEEPLSINEEGR